MWLESLTMQSLVSFFTTLTVIIAAAPIAHQLGLTDKPSRKKRHEGEIPLIGGIAIFLGLLVGAIFFWEANHDLVTVNGNSALGVLVGCGAFLVVTGVADDRFYLGIFLRVLSETLVAIAVIELLDFKVVYLGDLFGTGNLQMNPSLAYPFTIIAIVGIINAFNMLDGLDGLVASLVVITLALFHLLTGTQPSFVSLTVGSSLLAFLASNLSLSPVIPKTFLGDAGSKLLGFIVVCLVLAAASTQVSEIKLIAPVTALFLVAIPLYDMAFISLNRITRKGSPLTGDRSHIHHLIQALGFSDRRALIIILCAHSHLVVMGLLLHRASTPEYLQFALFVGGFGIYCLLSSQLWRVAQR